MQVHAKFKKLFVISFLFIVQSQLFAQGTRTWGGLVKSSRHYSFVDGGAMTAPHNAVFDLINNKWVAENTGVAPDIEQKYLPLPYPKAAICNLKKQ